MGQYYKLVCPTAGDHGEFVLPHTLGSGLKLWEIVNTHPGPLTALGLLLTVSNGRGGGDAIADDDPKLQERIDAYVGRWAGKAVYLVGDYVEDDDLPYEANAHQLYHKCKTLEDFTKRGNLLASDVINGQNAFADECRLEQCEGVHYEDISLALRPIIEYLCDGKFTHAPGWADFVPTPNRFCEECRTPIPDDEPFVTRRWQMAFRDTYSLHLICDQRRAKAARGMT